MTKKKKPHQQGHYCKICGEYKANEKFSGKGHATHICKACSHLSVAEKAESQTTNRLMNFPMGRLSDEQKKWLENRTHDSRLEVAALATAVYNIHFPHAERNAMKKQLSINTLTFEIHLEICDEYGDFEMVSRLFTVDRKSNIITLRELDTSEPEQSVTLAQHEMVKLLKWMVHTLEIFMWTQDYNLFPASDAPDLDLLPEYREDAGDSEDFETDFDLNCFILENTLPPEKPDGEPFWRVHVEYSNHTAQDIPCYNKSFPERPEELYLALLEYVLPEAEN